MKVYIVRHGQVLHNAMKQYNTSDEDLTELGIKQAEELRDKIKDMKFDIIISSGAENVNSDFLWFFRERA